MKKFLFPLSFIFLTSCHTGIHLFHSNDGMMIQELEKARLDKMDFQDEVDEDK